MIFHPCCGRPLQSGVKAIAIFQMMLGIVFFLGGMVMIGKSTRDCVVFMVDSIINMILATVLYKGASNRSYRKCRIWLLVEFSLFGLVFIGYAVGAAGENIDPTSHGISLVVNAYILWVVYEFVKELQEEEESNDGLSEGQKEKEVLKV